MTGMRRAFTLLESLTAVAILGALVGLLLPAVQKAREAAARSGCRNNLRQLALACHGHESATGRLPTAGVPLQHPPGDPRCGWAWQVLPHLDGGSAVALLPWGAAAAAGLPASSCPSRPPRTWPQWGGPGVARMTDYAGADLTGSGVLLPGRRGEGLPLAAVRAGTSNVLLLGEKTLNAAQARSGRNYDDDFGPFAGLDWDAMRTTAVPPRADYAGAAGGAASPPGYSAGGGNASFGGPHPGGVVCARADGSVSFTTYAIDPAAWRALGTR